jgi:hypothetical protein
MFRFLMRSKRVRSVLAAGRLCQGVQGKTLAADRAELAKLRRIEPSDVLTVTCPNPPPLRASPPDAARSYS